MGSATLQPLQDPILLTPCEAYNTNLTPLPRPRRLVCAVQVRAGRRVAGAVTGHPTVCDATSELLVRAARAAQLPARVLPGISCVDALMARAPTTAWIHTAPMQRRKSRESF
jgi:precorrin-4 methylase